MFGLSFEHLIVLGIVLLFFGPRRLPELGHTMGKAIRNFKDALAGVEEANFRKLGDADSKKDATKLAEEKPAETKPHDPSGGAPSA